jgi:hypothetical protein
MNYFLLMQEDRVTDLPSILSCPDNIDPIEWCSGNIMADPGPLRFTLPPNSSERRGGIISGIVTLFHKNLIAELDRLRIDNIQYFPIEMEAPDGMIEKAYSLINVIGMIDAVDQKNSDIRMSDARIRGEMKSFKIDPAKARGQRLFRIPEEPTLIVIDESLRDSLAAVKTPGVKLLPTERFRNPKIII